MFRCLVWIALAAGPLIADGGMVVLHRTSAPMVVTVFASPAPLHAGLVDTSVLLQSSDTLAPVLDADVRLEFTKDASRIEVAASRNQARNKLLYASSVHLDQPGEWRFSVSVRAANGSTPITTSGVLELAAAEPGLEAYWTYLAFPIICLAIFALHQWLRWASLHPRRLERAVAKTSPSNR